MKHNNTLTTLQTRTLLSLIKSDVTPLTDRETILLVSHEIVDYCINNFPAIYSNTDRVNYMAFTLAQVGQKAIKQKMLSCLEYVKLLAIIKESNENDLSDFGAFGDLYEVLIRIALMRSINLIKPSILMVKDILHSDIVSKKYGILEVGHNGKTFQEGTIFDYMEGNFTSVIYGVFSDDDKQAIYNYCIAGNIEKAIEYVKSYSVYWQDKHEFLNDMDSLTRGKGLTIKSGKVMVQFNSGKYNAFVNAIENGQFKALSEIL